MTAPVRRALAANDAVKLLHLRCSATCPLNVVPEPPALALLDVDREGPVLHADRPGPVHWLLLLGACTQCLETFVDPGLVVRRVGILDVVPYSLPVGLLVVFDARLAEGICGLEVLFGVRRPVEAGTGLVEQAFRTPAPLSRG